MIYYKKRSLIKKAINLISQKTEGKKPRVFSFSKNFFIFICLLLVLLYSSYLFLMPKLIDENNAKTIINNYILKNSKLTLDTKDFSIKPDYKFNLNLKAKYAKLKYPTGSDFIVINDANVDINLFSLLYGYIDLNKIKTKDILIYTNFTKNNKYECFDYFDLTNKKKSNFKLRNINLLSDNLSLNLYDENVKKTFYLKTSKLKVNSNEYRKLLDIETNGSISSNRKIADFFLKLSIKLNPESSGKFKEKLAKLNYNPLKDADKYDFYATTSINLKINPQKQNVSGFVNLKNYTFKINNIELPKNNLLLTFKDSRIYSNCDFNLINNQKIKINSTANFSKNKFIEAKLYSTKINLADFKNIFSALCEILNLKFDFKDIALTGSANVDLYLKSNFKTLNSSGKLLIENAQIHHKKTGLTLKNISSSINFANNFINIYSTNAFVNDAKFNLSGTIDNKTNLNLKINSEPINIAQVIALIKELPFLNKISPALTDYSFKDGLLKINSTVNGKLENPIIKTSSTLSNLKLYLKKYDANFASSEILISANPEKNTFKEIFITGNTSKLEKENKILTIPKVELKILNNDIILSKTNLFYEKNPFIISGIIKNYKTKQNEISLALEGKLPKNNIFKIKKEDLKFNSSLLIKQDKLTITSGNITDKQSTLGVISGNILNLSKEAILNLKLQLNEKINLSLFNNIDLSAIGNIELTGKPKNPDISGKLNLSNISSPNLNLDINNAILTAKNSQYYINIEKGHIFDFDFDLIANAKYLNNKFIIDFANLHTMYANLNSFEKYLKNSKQSNFNYEINNLKANVLTLELGEILLNSVNLEGSIKDDILNITNLNADYLNGKIQGKGIINLLNQKIKTELILKELNIRQLSNKFKELSIAASGKLSALINADFQGYNIENILQTFDGYIKFNIDNGELAQFAKLERFLQAGNIISQSISKLTLNSTLSAITKQNTGDFKTIEGTVKIKNSNANIQYINTQGSNMSLHITGEYNLLNNYTNTKILGRIPNSIVSVMGNFGSFSFSKFDKENQNQTSTKFSTTIPQEEIEKIPPLAYTNETQNTREFIVLINGIATNLNSIKDFKWANK